MAASLLANAGSLLALGQPFVRLEVEAGRSCFLTFNSHVMADGSLICLCEQAAAPASQAASSLVPALSAALPPHLMPPRLRSATDDALAGIAGSFAFIRNPLPLWIFDRQTLAFVAVNDAALARYGYSPERFMGMKISDIRPAEDVPRLLDSMGERAVVRQIGPVAASSGRWADDRRTGRPPEWFTLDGRPLP